MGWDFCTTTTPKAQKDYPCEAWDWLDNSDWSEFTCLTFSERKTIVNAKRNGFRIKKGEKYLKVTGKWEGEFMVFRAIPGLDDICRVYDLYDN